MSRVPAWIALAGLALAPVACGNGDPTAASPVSPAAPSSAIQVSGYVDDTTFKAMSNVIVEVLDGAQVGNSTFTDASGRFTLTGQFDQATRFRAKKDGYQSTIQALQSTPMLFFLGVDGPSTNTATLTVEADPACTALPDEVRTRTYPATVTAAHFSGAQANTTFYATLSGASLDSYFHFVLIEVAGDLVTFDMSDNGIEEEVAEETYHTSAAWLPRVHQQGQP